MPKQRQGRSEPLAANSVFCRNGPTVTSWRELADAVGGCGESSHSAREPPARPGSGSQVILIKVIYPHQVRDGSVV